ncbi:hypothetical protein FQZ97_885440 [compost metagenome]
MASRPLWKYVPSPRLAKMCWSVVKGCWPTHGTPSPPICVKPMVERSIQVAMKWQPMPPIAREPSGTTVLVLCGQPEQNQGWRVASATLVDACCTTIARSLASRMASCASMRAAMSAPAAAKRPVFFRRAAMALAMRAGFRSALARSSVCEVGLGIDHSPPE